MIPRGRTACIAVAVAAAAASQPAAAAGEPLTLVACAPGYPGSTAEAQETMDELARSVEAQVLTLALLLFVLSSLFPASPFPSAPFPLPSCRFPRGLILFLSR